MKRIFAIVLAGLFVTACEKTVEAPDVKGVCYQVINKKDGTTDFSVVAKDIPSLEACAAELDAVRFRFMGMGSSRTEISGAYNGTFLFLDSGGMSTAPNLHAGRFVAFGRGPDGRLTLPTNVRQPGPQGAGIFINQDPKKEPKIAPAPAKK